MRITTTRDLITLPAFVPITMTIVLNTRAEFAALYGIGFLNISVPLAVTKEFPHVPQQDVSEVCTALVGALGTYLNA